jgi:concanavalin A-like lectin/glucanase superfamily protein
MRTFFSRTVLVCSVALVFTACGGGDGLSARLLLTSEAPGSNCPLGGSRIDAGIDADGNGVLDPTEVTSTQYVCNGAGGAAGATGATGAGASTLLVETSNEAAGANCAAGGQRIRAGYDSNGNGVLDAAEVASTGYVCSGATGPGITWVHVTGSSVQTSANTGYLADNTAQVTVTLPTNPVLGDLVQISGVGPGGWRLAQNAGQSVATGNLSGGVFADVWTARDAARSWRAVASSSDGMRLAAVVAGGQVYTSSDAGSTWTARETNRNWSSVASSSDGTRLVATVAGGQIYTSVDAGATWVPRDSNRAWQAIASSADGAHLAAVVDGGQIYTSVDSGATWTARESGRLWTSVASSSDGSRLVAVGHGSQIYTSTDSGASWTARESVRNWNSVATSADGSRLAAVVAGGQIYTSTDAGASWTARELDRGWRSVASSVDGTRLAAVLTGGAIYTSNDSGVTWTARASGARFWNAVASSADGTRLVAVEDGGQAYTTLPTFVDSTVTGSGGSIVGRQHDALDLQYVGNGTFMVRSASGVFDIAQVGASAGPASAAPTLSLPSVPMDFIAGSSAAALDPAATTADADSTTLGGGTLTVALTANADVDDRLDIRSFGSGAGQIAVAGSQVSYEGTVIGRYAGGVSADAPLIVYLGNVATPAAAQALLRAVVYRNAAPSDPANPDRVAQVTQNDGQGGTSVPASQTLRVHDRLSNLIAQWQFDETPSATTAIDSSGSGHDATLFNLATTDWLQGGVIGQSLSTSAATSQYLSTSLDLRTVANFSFSLWIKPNAAAASQVQHILWQGAPNQNGWGAGLAPSAGGHEMHLSLNYFNACLTGLSFYFGSTDPRDPTTCADRSNALVSDALPPASTWTHVVVNVRGADTALATVELYVNGSLRSTDTSDEVDRSLWQGNLQFAKPATNSRYYSGELDHIRVFSRSLSPAEITLLFEEGRR